MAFMGSRGQGNGTAVAIIVAVVLVVGVFGGLMWWSTNKLVKTQQTAIAPGAAPGVSLGLTTAEQLGLPACPGVSGVTVTYLSKDAINTGTLTGETHTVWLKDPATGNWNRKGTVSNGGTNTVGPNIDVKVLFGNNSEAILGGAATSPGFYPTVKEFRTGCSDVTFETLQLDKNDSAQTLVFFNSDDDLANSGADAESIGADAIQTVRMQFKGSSNDYFGTDKMVVVFDANTTTFDKVAVLDKNTGLELPTVAIPRSHTNLAGMRTYAYELPGLVSSNQVSYNVMLDASTTDPTPVGAQANITVHAYPSTWYLNAKTDQPELGYNDEDGNAVGVTAIRGVLAVS